MPSAALDTATRFRVNAPPVVHESFDDEVVLVNLETGVYYSLDRPGVPLWGWVDAGASVGEMVAAARDGCAGDAAEIEAGVRRLLAELCDERLIVVDPAPPRAAVPAPQDRAGERPPFQAPTLTKFSDMAELLTVDPIHEVGAGGWPEPPGGA